MIGHIERHPGVRDRAIFVGEPEDIVPLSFGKDLPAMRDWVPRHFDFAGYIIGEHPEHFGSRAELRAAAGLSAGRAGLHRHGRRLGRRRASDQAHPAELADGPRPAARAAHDRGGGSAHRSRARSNAPAGVEVRAFVPDLDRHLAACDLALVQGGLTTCMELTAAGTPFLYFPLKNHFEQNFHVAHRLDRYGAGTAHGVRDVDAGHDRRRDGRRAGSAGAASSRSKPTAPRARRACWRKLL